MSAIKMPCPGGGKAATVPGGEPYEICDTCGRNLRVRPAGPRSTLMIVPRHSRNARYGGDL